jgi:hypothetical protein
MRRIYDKGKSCGSFTDACVYKTIGEISSPEGHVKNVTTYNLLNGYQSYGEICYPYHQENFLSCPGNETTRFVRNIGSYIPDHTKLLFRRPYS